MESPAFVNFLSAYGFSFKPLPAGADLDHAVAPLLAVTLHGRFALIAVSYTHLDVYKRQK